jgi:hypothetical protein
MMDGMSGWNEDDDLESFEAERDRHELSPGGVAETNRQLVVAWRPTSSTYF